MDETQSIASSFTAFLEGAMIAIFEEAAQLPLSQQGYKEEISPGKKFEDVVIPYFYVHDIES